MPPTIISKKKRNAVEAGLSQDGQKPSAEVEDVSVAQETGVLGKYDEIPQENTAEEEKKRAKKEYQKKKLKKQRQSKKGFEIIREDTDLVRLVDEDDDSVDIIHHLGLQHAKDTADLKQVKKKSRLGRALLNDNEDDDVLVFKKNKNKNDEILAEDKTLGDKKGGKKDKKDKKDKKNSEKIVSNRDNLTKRQLRKELKNSQEKKDKNTMLSNEHQKQLNLLNLVAGKQETWASTRVSKEEKKIEFFDEKEMKKIEKKKKEKQIRQLMLEQVRIKNAAAKKTAKENKSFKDEKV
jgi:hypothetical protein